MQTTTKKMYTIKEFCRDIIPLSEGGAYKAAIEGKIPSVKVGKRIFIPAWYVNEILNKPAASGAEG